MKKIKLIYKYVDDKVKEIKRSLGRKVVKETRYVRIFMYQFFAGCENSAELIVTVK